MKCRIAITVFCMFAVLTLSASADILNALRPGLETGKLVDASKSPDGKWALFEVNAFDLGRATTAMAIVVASQDRANLLGSLNVVNSCSADLPWKNYLTLKWSPQSKYLAVHDATPKNSVLQIIRVTPDGLKTLEIPDLRHLAEEKFHLSGKKITGSGQVPVAWLGPNDLQVDVRVSTREETNHLKITLHVSSDEVVKAIVSQGTP